MNRSEYTRRVLSQLKRLTRAETEAIRAEIDGHMEDCYLSMLDLGYPAEVAEERTLSRMGDPEEVGRELNKQYPLGWLVLKWGAMALTAALVFLLVTTVNWMNVWWNLNYRFSPKPVTQYQHEAFTFLWEHPIDIRVQIEDTVIRACAAGIMKTADYPYWGMWEDVPDEIYLAAITFCPYSADLDELAVRRHLPDRWMRGAQSVGASGYASVWLVPVEPGQESVTVTYEEYGQDVSMVIPLDWEGVG